MKFTPKRGQLWSGLAASLHSGSYDGVELRRGRPGERSDMGENWRSQGASNVGEADWNRHAAHSQPAAAAAAAATFRGISKRQLWRQLVHGLLTAVVLLACFGHRGS